MEGRIGAALPKHRGRCRIPRCYEGSGTLSDPPADTCYPLEILPLSAMCEARCADYGCGSGESILLTHACTVYAMDISEHDEVAKQRLAINGTVRMSGFLAVPLINRARGRVRDVVFGIAISSS